MLTYVLFTLGVLFQRAILMSGSALSPVAINKGSIEATREVCMPYNLEVVKSITLRF